MKKILLVLALLLLGCRSSSTETTISERYPQVPNSNFNQIINSKHVIPVLDNEHILINDPITGLTSPVYKLTEKQIPPIYNLGDIRISPSKDFIVWYAPQTGLLAYNLNSKEVVTLRESNQWLSNNPFYRLDTSEDIVYIIDDEGNSLYTIDLVDGGQNRINIPYPFGNEFKISPNGQQILFIAGFGQSENDPEYMVTNIEGENPVRFTAETLLNLRNQADWLANNTDILMVGQDSRSLIVVDNSGNQRDFYTHNDDSVSIVDLFVIEDLIYYFTTDKRWHVLDSESKEKVASMPLAVAGNMDNPDFVPWYDQSFLIEETIRSNESQYKKLHYATFKGETKVIIDSYANTQITTDTTDL